MSNEHKILLPFYQVKSVGHVIEHTNSLNAADSVYREAVAPAEIWKIGENGSAQLIRQKKS